MELQAPALPFVPITVGGRDLKMCFDLGSISRAETEIRKHDPDVYLLFAPWRMTLANVRALFVASLAAYQPEMPYEEAVSLVTWQSVLGIAEALQTAYSDFMPVPEDGGAEEGAADPTEAPEAQPAS